MKAIGTPHTPKIRQESPLKSDSGHLTLLKQLFAQAAQGDQAPHAALVEGWASALGNHTAELRDALAARDKTGSSTATYNMLSHAGLFAKVGRLHGGCADGGRGGALLDHP